MKSFYDEPSTTVKPLNYCHIGMSREDAELFYWMQKYRDIFLRAFKELRPGNMVLHFDSLGKIQKHEYHFFPK